MAPCSPICYQGARLSRTVHSPGRESLNVLLLKEGVCSFTALLELEKPINVSCRASLGGEGEGRGWGWAL